eukprot:TRINITY_DN970_c0_g1_i2.p1 TRINITY_DN970_c0_g1~~TRINITY_DN970_c0_g1_i2.p1  ORF type:complete len:316 (+),score=40.85 TRINITY_DN970_c0_g1_i2:494-1441(+)
MLRAASFRELNERFDRLSCGINSMLAGKIPVRPLNADCEQHVSLDPGLKCHYKIRCKDQAVPLRMRVAMHQGIYFSYISLSQLLERPNKERNDKVFLVSNNHSCLTYHGDKGTDKFFKSNYIYVTLECEKKCVASIKVSFGKARAKESVLEKNEELIDFPIEAAATSRETLKQRFFTLRKGTVATCKPKTRPRYVNAKEYRKRVLLLRDMKQDRDAALALLKYNRRKVNEMHEAILRRRDKELSDFRKSLKLWVCIAKMTKFGATLYDYLMQKKKEKEANENILFTGIRIKIKFQAKMKRLSKDFKDRMDKKVNT